MWLITQQADPDDYVLATGEARSVREFVEEAFAQVGKKIVWRGSGVDEKGLFARPKSISWMATQRRRGKNSVGATRFHSTRWSRKWGKPILNWCDRKLDCEPLLLTRERRHCEWCNDGPSIRAGMDIAMQISLLQSVPKKDLHNMLDRVSGTVSARQHQGHDRHWLHCGASPGYTEFELI